MTPQDALSGWFERQARALPWRRTREPYPIWISEVMLQQTQVTTVIPYYHRFLERFPTIHALAEAPEAEVLRLWSGLGYYSRARSLHRAAKHLVEHHAGDFPRERERLLEVPGIGPYTAGAVLSIAYDLPVPLVDGNVQRVFARYYGYDGTIESSAARDFFWEKAREWVVAARSPRVLNQALMELGATVCTRGVPKCGACPIAGNCVARKTGSQAELPRRKPRRQSVELYWLGLVLEARGKIWLHRNPSGQWWADLWDVPRVELSSRAQGEAAIREVATELGEVTSCEQLDSRKHTVTHHKIFLTPYRLRLPRPLLPAIERDADGAWFTRDEALRLPLSSLARKVLVIE